MSEEEKGTRTGCLAGYSPFFGVGAFAFLELPEPWELRMIAEPPECDLLGSWNSTGDFRWVLRGKLKAALVNEEAKRAYLVCVEAKDFARPEDAERYLAKRLAKREARSRVLERGSLTISGHRAHYMAIVERERKLLGRGRERHVLVVAFFCRETERLLWLELIGGPSLLEDLGELKPIISSLSCHG